MIRHDPVLPPEFIFPIDDWRWVERRFTPEFVGQAETTFSTANVQPTITWSSSNQSVATIDIAGFATGKANGSTDITAVVRVGRPCGKMIFNSYHDGQNRQNSVGDRVMSRSWLA